MTQKKESLNILITGSTGFVGNVLVPHLQKAGHIVSGTGLESPGNGVSYKYFQVPDLTAEKRWDAMLNGNQVVIHLAARAHQMGDGPKSDSLYFQTNLEGTKAVSQAAMKAGVSRFIFVSSIKAMGEETYPGLPWTEDSSTHPQDAYGRSKLEAEKFLNDLHQNSGFPVVIFRPPLMYGPNVKGNMFSLMRLIEKGVPLPLGGLNNQRSFLNVKNLASAIETALTHQKAIGKTFLVADGPPITTSQLVEKMTIAAGKTNKIFRLPKFFWKTCVNLPWVGARVKRLIGSLALDTQLIFSELGWVPPYDYLAGFAEAFAALRAGK